MLAAVRQWEARGSYLTLAGRQLFYVDEGSVDKPAIVLVHGFPTASWDWHKIWPYLAQDYRLIAPDMLGFGLSDKPSRHVYSIHEQADFIEGLVHHLKLTSAHLLAHDYGDSVAQELLARDNARPHDPRSPKGVLPPAKTPSGVAVAGERSGGSTPMWRSLCLLNGGLFPETHRPRLTQQLLRSPLGSLVTRVVSRATLSKNMRAIFGPQSQPSDQELAVFWALIAHKQGRLIFHRLIRYMDDRISYRERWLAALTQARVPVQLINGSQDPISGEHMVSRYRELVGTERIVELPAIGHYPQIEAPQQVARHYRDFVDGL